MDIRRELKVSKEDICFLEDVDTLTEKEFNEKYKGKKAEHRMYVIPFEDAKTGDYYSDITISVNPGEGHIKGTTSITLCWDTYGKKVQFAENGTKFTGEYRFPINEDKIYTLDISCTESLDKWKVKDVDVSRNMRNTYDCYAFVLQKEDGKERDVFMSIHSKMMYNVMQEALLVNPKKTATAREAFWSLDKAGQKQCIQNYVDKEISKRHEVVSLVHTSLDSFSLSSRCLLYRESECNTDKDKKEFFSKACSVMGKSEETVINEALKEINSRGLEGFKINLKDGRIHTYISTWVQEQLERNGSFADLRKGLEKELGMEKTGLGKKKNQKAKTEEMGIYSR